jgi:hypothetical protein
MLLEAILFTGHSLQLMVLLSVSALAFVPAGLAQFDLDILSL